MASYIFPAGGQRGRTVDVRVGGLFLHHRCGLDLQAPGVEASRVLHRVPSVWFEGPLLPLPDSQQAEDYPRAMAGTVRIAADAPLGPVPWRLWTAQGATGALRFMVGDLPEVIEHEVEGDAVPVDVRLPVTVNGRIFPREDVDAWAFELRRGETACAEVWAARLGSPLDARLEVRDPQGRPIAENDDTFGPDPFVRFTAPADGKYQVRIHDVKFGGGPAFVYRLTLTAGPHVDRAYPLGGRRGSTVRLELSGQNLPAGPVAVPLPAGGPGVYLHRLAVGATATNPFALELDDLPEHLEAEPNDDPAAVRPVAVPAVLNGRIDRPGDVDWWAFSARKGEAFECELRAARLGSPLEGVLTLTDAAGKELVRADALGSVPPDPTLHFTAPADGVFRIAVADRFASRGGPAFAYRLRIDHPAGPGFRLQLPADALTVPRGGQATLKVAAERLGGFAGPIALAFDGLPPGVTATGTTIAAGQSAADVVLKAGPRAAVGAGRVMVRGSSAVGGRAVAQTATLSAASGLPPLDTVLVAVAVPTPFQVKAAPDTRWAPRGTVVHRRYRIDRGGFAGPIEVTLADRQARHLQGARGPTVTVPAGVSEFDYPVSLPPWMETGRTCRVCVMATGVVKDPDGSAHEVSFSSVTPEEQVIVVVEPGRLGLDVDQASVLAEPGRTAAVPVRLTRGKGLTGPAKVELVVPAHLRGIAATPVIVPAGHAEAALAVRFAANVRGPFNAPVIVRATVLEGGEPVVAEAKLTLRPVR